MNIYDGGWSKWYDFEELFTFEGLVDPKLKMRFKELFMNPCLEKNNLRANTSLERQPLQRKQFLIRWQ